MNINEHHQFVLDQIFKLGEKTMKQQSVWVEDLMLNYYHHKVPLSAEVFFSREGKTGSKDRRAVVDRVKIDGDFIYSPVILDWFQEMIDGGEIDV